MMLAEVITIMNVEKVVSMEQKIKLACTLAGISESELARRIGTTPQNLHQRLKVGRFTVEELARIGEALGARYVCEFRFPDGTTI